MPFAPGPTRSSVLPSTLLAWLVIARDLNEMVLYCFYSFSESIITDHILLYNYIFFTLQKKRRKERKGKAALALKSGGGKRGIILFTFPGNGILWEEQ